MKNKQQDDVIQFDFHTGDGAKRAPLLFSNPLDIITTNKLSEVAACMQRIEKALDEQYYVAGYFSYEVTYALQKMDYSSQVNKMPLLWFGVFDAPVNTSVVNNKTTGTYQLGSWEMAVSKEQYAADFQQVMNAIEAGRTEQINYTVPFEAPFTGDAYTYYQQLKAAQQSDYCAYLSFDAHTILSASPELFFHLKDDVITVRPMKGTAGRGKTITEDELQRKWLQQSEKNRLENQLITNLMTQELKKVTLPYTLQQIDQFRLETYPTVFQMTSGVTGRTHPNLSVTDIIRALFPCGSISGVPKQESLALISTLEKRAREVYCGAIGYITPQREALFNVPIRTVWIDHQTHTAHYGAGGAITKKSLLEEEYAEVVTKTDVLTWQQPDFQLLETIAVENGACFLLQEHLKRLQASAAYFKIQLNLSEIQGKLIKTAKLHTIGKWRLRLTVNQNGKHAIGIQPLKETVDNPYIVLADEPINRNNVFLYHKTTFRSFYESVEQHQDKGEEVLSVLLWNEKGEITECTIGNLVLEQDGQLYTPPVACGLLPGTYREKLLQEGKLQERIIHQSEITPDSRLWLINSVRKWVRVTLLPSDR